MKVALKLAYLGDNYYGFQKQPDRVTVDSQVRRALAQIGVIHGDFCYAGRTDRGVSALGQVIDFWIDEDKIDLTRPRCVNGRLPRDIWTWAWSIAPVGFSARWNALWREYQYLLWHPGLDRDLMEEAAEMLLGEHDFRNFSSAKVGTVKTVRSWRYQRETAFSSSTSGQTAFCGIWCERSWAPSRRWARARRICSGLEISSVPN